MAAHTVRILLRLPPALHQRAKERASELNTSLNSALVRAIERGLSGIPAEQFENTIITKATHQFGSAFVGLLLYGSRARGDAYDTSDTDLMLVVDQSVKIERSLYRDWDAALPEDTSLMIAHIPVTARDAGSLWLECALDARILYDPTGTLRMRLEEIKELILSGVFVRRTTHGQGYWISQ
jgi:predicted nucleotidyltransferase